MSFQPSILQGVPRVARYLTFSVLSGVGPTVSKEAIRALVFRGSIATIIASGDA